MTAGRRSGAWARTAAGLLVLAACIGQSKPADATDWRLTLLHTADIRSRFSPINSLDATCAPGEDARGQCQGGVARLRTKVVERRIALARAREPALLLDAGGWLGGSLLHTLYRGKAAAEFANAIGYDAIGLGIPDFAAGSDDLLTFLSALRVPAIAGNALAGAGSPLAGRLPPYLIRDVAGRRVAILSVAAADAQRDVPAATGLLLGDEIASLRSQVAEVAAAGVDVVIVLSHAGLDRDREIAAAVDGIDVIVGGRSHTVLSDSRPDAEGQYPLFVAAPSGSRVAIVHAGAHGRMLGEIALAFDARGELESARGEPHVLDGRVAPDTAVAARVAALETPIVSALGRPVGQLAAPAMDADRCRAAECAIGNLVADAMLDHARPLGASAAILNAGSIRTGIGSGPVLLGDVHAALPYQETVAIVAVDGADLMKALGHGLSGDGRQSGRFPQVAGLRLVVDPSAAGDGRLVGAEVRGGDTWSPVESGQRYTIAVAGYMRRGGDGYEAFAASPGRRSFGANLEDVVAAYLSARQPLATGVDDRIAEAGAGDAAIKPDVKIPAKSAAGAAGTDGESQPASQEPAAATGATPSAPPPMQTYRVRRGDTLSTLSQRFYGTSRKVGVIEQANPGLRRRGLRIGDDIVIPAQ